MRNILKLLPILIGVRASAASTPHVLRSFGVNQQEGSDVYAGLILDAAGNAYGATESGGSHNSGVVFRLSPDGTGRWTETILHEFKGSPEDGATPHASLVFDGAGNLYGTTVSGGIASSGTVFKLAPTSEGQWTETVLHRRCRRCYAIWSGYSGRGWQHLRDYGRGWVQWAWGGLQALLLARRVDRDRPA